MKSVLVFFALLISASAAYPQTAPDTSEYKLFRALAEQWRIYYNADDTLHLSELYTQDAEYVSGHVAGLVASGRDNVIRNFHKGISLGGHIDKVEVLLVNMSCDLATLFCRYEANNSGQKATGRNVLILKKVKGKWLIKLHMTVV